MKKFRQVNVFVEFQLAVPSGENLQYIIQCLDAKVKSLAIEYASDNNYSASVPLVSAGMNTQDDPE